MPISVFILIVLLSLFVLSCSDEGGFINLPGDDPPQIQTHDDGAILQDSLSIRLLEQRGASSDANGDLTVLVSYHDEQGLPVGEAIRYSASRFLGSDPEPLPLPDMLEPGIYKVSVELKRGTTTERRVERTVFLGDSEDNYAVDRVEFYPDFLYPGSDGILTSSLRYPDGVDPFLRWSVGDARHEGLLSEGLQELHIRAPAKEGFYPVTLELFPFAPPDNWSGYTFASTVRNSSHRMIVRRASGSESLGSEEYFSLLSFQGNLREEGARVAGREYTAQAVGDPQFVRLESFLGYSIKAGEGFSIEDSVLPFQDGKLMAFALELRVIVHELEGNNTPDNEYSNSGASVIVRSETRGGGPRFVLLHDTEGRLLLEIGVRDLRWQAETAEPILVAGRPAEIEILVFPEQHRMQVIFTNSEGHVSQTVLNDLSAQKLRVPDAFLSRVASPMQRAAGLTVLGGEAGFTGIVGRFGVRTAAQADSTLFGELVEAFGPGEATPGEATPGENDNVGDEEDSSTR
ncbi:MAG: hypothetical protein EA428_02800 [Spirochaetaceae bacterium]|nr:MAG: hypothetical protein EA428_02800 [Spirochaetaceae bacterium]